MARIQYQGKTLTIDGLSLIKKLSEPIVLDFELNPINIEMFNPTVFASTFVNSDPTNGESPYSYEISKDLEGPFSSSITVDCDDFAASPITVYIKCTDSTSPTSNTTVKNTTLTINDSFGVCP